LDTVVDLNLKSPFWLIQALLPALRKAGTADDPARIINIGSIAAIHIPARPNYSYSSSKAGLHQLTRVLAKELGPQHVTVNAVAPGPFPSTMMAATLDEFGEAIAASAPLRRIGRDDDMAGVAVFLAKPGRRLPDGRHRPRRWGDRHDGVSRACRVLVVPPLACGAGLRWVDGRHA
jgi:NAD(P)-dependent dehydrogenase (short-subunit alcohol dehydrogenase family)